MNVTATVAELPVTTLSGELGLGVPDTVLLLVAVYAMLTAPVFGVPELSE
jgi:hypothetical protein